MLDDDGRRLLSLLVQHLPLTNTDQPDRMLGYKKAHEMLGLKNLRGNWAESLKVQGLNNLAQWTKDTAKPAITGIIVNQESHSPGRGYYTLFGKSDGDWGFLREQVEAAKSFDWAPYLEVSKAPSSGLPQTPNAVDLDGPVDRVETSVFRIIRDTNLSRKIKAIHKFECQICGMTIELPSGERYAEAHHIKPLGSPHNGPDVAENIICLCPNHHAEMDYGVSRLDRDSIRLTPSHQIADDYLTYHNSEIYFKISNG